MKNPKKSNSSGLVEAAKRFAGDAEEDATPISTDEAAAMSEVRREHRRPSAAEIREAAKKMLG